MRSPLAVRAVNFAAFSLITLLCGTGARADDSEIFIQTEVEGSAANLLLIIDSSGSMHDTAVSQTKTPSPYDSTLKYSDSSTSGPQCDSNRIYFRLTDPMNTTPPASCSGLAWIPSTPDAEGNNMCAASRPNLQYGKAAYASRTGSYMGTFIRWYGTKSNNRNWTSTLTGGTTSNFFDLECQEDANIHGNDSNTANKYPRTGPGSGTGYWGNNGSGQRSWWSTAGNAGTEAILWSPNFIRYTKLKPTTNLGDDQSRLTVVKQAAKNLLDSPLVTGMNVGLMRYSTNYMEGATGIASDDLAAGGMVLWPVIPIDEGTNRQQLKDLIDGIKEAGRTPLSETLYEAHQYYAGATVDYGLASKICTLNNRTDNSGGNAFCASKDDLVSKPSISTSRVTGNQALYKSPADTACQHNYIVYLTDGLPTSDGISSLVSGGTATSRGIRAKVEALQQNLVKPTGSGGLGQSDVVLTKTCDTGRSDDGGECLVALSEYMGKADLRATVQGKQTVTTFFIGFGDDFAGGLTNTAFQYLANAATASGGEAFQANDLPQLEGAFNSIVASVADTNTTFTAPTVAVNAFNRTQTLSDLYVAVFAPSTKRHWPGNLKKYTIAEGVIKDRDGNDAVDSQTGFFKDQAFDKWATSTAGHGYDVIKGGAANLLPSPASRKVYTYISASAANPSSPVTLGSSNLLSTSNVSDTDLQIGNAGDPARADLIDWALGRDVPGTTPRNVMGDPMHSQPAIVIYGGTASSPEGVVYVPTNDGYLHAINADTGVELWSFIPQEILPQLKLLYQNGDSSTKSYTLDGEVRVLKYDINGDGTVSDKDRVFIYFGQGRGGSKYYAMDVTDKDNPKFMWAIGLPDAGRTWSPPTVAHVSIGDGSAQNKQHLVLIMAGGYDPAEDNSVYVTSSPIGNRIYMVDAVKGTLLWSAGSDTSNANLKLDRMDHSIPSRVTVMDVDQDGMADRMYVGDMAGQVWRFDITNSTTATPVSANALVNGGVIASLGAHDLDAATPAATRAANARRFYNAPDVVAVENPGGTAYLSINIGSGYRGKPTNKDIQDRFYALRDFAPFRAMTSTEYRDINDAPVMDDDVTDITEDVAPALPANAAGWKLRLATGEKVLSDSTTFDRSTFFVTYTPSTGSTSDTCLANSTGGGSNSVYIVNLINGAPVIDMRDTSVPGEGDPKPGDPPPELTGDDRSTDLNQGGIASGVTFLFPEANKLVCLSGVEVLGACTDFKSRIKTYWREAGSN